MKSWTKDEEELLVLWKKQDYSNLQIAEKLQRTKDSVKQKCRRLKLSSNIANIKLSHEEYCNKVKEVFIVLEPYINRYTKILHECILCGEQYKRQAVSTNINKGCKYCSNKNNTGTISLLGTGITYLVYIPRYNLYKIGITAKSVAERMADIGIYKYDCIIQHIFDNPIDAVHLERQWKNNLKDLLVNTGKLKTGNTETFRY